MHAAPNALFAVLCRGGMRAFATWVVLLCAVWWRGASARPVAGEAFRRVVGRLCAEALLPGMIGPCPRSVPVLFGRLVPGRCSTLGYTVPAGEKHVLAGPCGWMKFDVFTPEPAQPCAELASILHPANYLRMPIASCPSPHALFASRLASGFRAAP